MPIPTPTPEELAAAPEPPVREPEPGPAPVVDPLPGLEPDPEPNPDPQPDTPDPEPDRDPRPGPPGGPDPAPDTLPRTDPPTSPAPMQAAPQISSKTSAAPQVPKKVAAPQVPQGSGPQLVLTAPSEKPAKPPKSKKPEDDSPEFPISVIIGKVYQGPLDLLLDLIRKQDIDIYDIPIARVTSQFLAYVEQLKATDVDLAGEFIYTAALLIHIKSKMLLPRAPSGPDEAIEDPRRELVERLLEHERFKNAAQMLQEKQMLEAATWTNPGIREFKDDVHAEPEIAADTTDLVRVFRDIMERIKRRPTFNVQEDTVTVGQMIQYLGRRLVMEDKPISLRRLLAHSKSERSLVAMFLALLELVRLQAVLLRQDRAFSDIYVKKNTEFDAVIAEAATQTTDDWR